MVTHPSNVCPSNVCLSTTTIDDDVSRHSSTTIEDDDRGDEAFDFRLSMTDAGARGVR